MHCVSSAPSKIPYGEFSPVRLQAGCPQRPSPSAGGFDAATVEISSARVWFRSRTCVRRHSQLLTPPTCPVALGSPPGYSVRAGSSLTMATSAPLAATPRLMDYSAKLPVSWPAPEGPQFTPPVLSPHAAVRTPVVPSAVCDDSFADDAAFAEFVPARQPQYPTNPERVGRVTKLQHSLYAAAWRRCLPCSGQDVYDRAFRGRVTPLSPVGYNWMANHHLPSPDFHWLDCRPYGLRTNGADFAQAASLPSNAIYYVDTSSAISKCCRDNSLHQCLFPCEPSQKSPPCRT